MAGKYSFFLGIVRALQVGTAAGALVALYMLLTMSGSFALPECNQLRVGLARVDCEAAAGEWSTVSYFAVFASALGVVGSLAGLVAGFMPELHILQCISGVKDTLAFVFLAIAGAVLARSAPRADDAWETICDDADPGASLSCQRIVHGRMMVVRESIGVLFAAAAFALVPLIMQVVAHRARLASRFWQQRKEKC